MTRFEIPLSDGGDDTEFHIPQSDGQAADDHKIEGSRNQAATETTGTTGTGGIGAQAGLTTWLAPLMDPTEPLPVSSAAPDLGQSAVELIPSSNPNFNQQWHLRNTTAGQFDLNVTDVWDDYTGAGVRVVVIDTGVDRNHEDLVANINFALDYDYVDNDFIAEPVGTASSQHHGTAVAGIVGAVDNNVGGVGVAYDVDLVAFRGYGIFGDYGSEVWQDAAGRGDNVGNTNGDSTDGDVVTMSGGTGSSVFYFTNDNWDAVLDMADNAANGRGGLGTVMVKSAGNSRAGANSTLREEGTAELWDSTRHTINVAAVERDGDITNYSSPGANVLVSAFAPSQGQSPGIFTTDRTGTDGYNSTNYTSTFNGTSAAAPQVAGVTALMLEANPNLGWRDVQKILALTARQSGSEVGAAAQGFEQAIQGSSQTWFWNDASVGTSNLHWNSGGLHFSNDYGFGIVDALAAVRLAETWELTGTSGAGGTEVSETQDMDGFGVTTNYSTSFVNHTATFDNDIIVQHITVNVDFDIDDLDDMEIFVISPNGTRLQLINDTGDTRAMNTADAVNESTGFGGTGNRGWNFGAVGFLGEQGNGTWTVQIRNDDGSGAGTFSTSDVDLTIYGDTRTTDDLFVFTNEYSDYDGVGGHLTTASGGSGTDTFNAAAVTSASTVNLSANTAIIDGVSMTSVSAIERVFTGDGNDTVIGDSFGEFISTGRGNDSVTGGSADETIQGGDGSDSLSGGSGDDTIQGGDGNDTLEGGAGFDRLEGGAGNDTFLYSNSQDVIGGVEQLFGGSGTDKIRLEGAGFYDLGGDGSTSEGINVFSIEEIEFAPDGPNIDKTIRLSNKELDTSGEFATNLLIDGNFSTGSNDRIIIDVNSGNNLDVSGWTFQDWQDDLDSITILGDADANNISGTSENDSISGGGGDDTLLGNAGDDTLNSGAGSVSLDGGSGDDLLIKSGFLATPADTFNGGTGNDTIRSDATWASTVTFNLANGHIQLSGADREDITSIENAVIGGAASAIGTAGANLLQATGFDATFNANMLDGGSGNDTLIGGIGNDTLMTGAGADSVLAGNDDDLIIHEDGLASNAVDTLNGGSGNDTLESDLSWSSSVVFDLDNGETRLGTALRQELSLIENVFAGGSAQIIGNSGANLLRGIGTGTGNNNFIDGGAGNDTLDGGAGDDTLAAGAGQDSVLGGAGDDLLIKSDALTFGQDDTFNGGSGNDTLDTGAGWADTVMFNLASGRASVGSSNRDFLIGIENLLVGGNASAIGTTGANLIVGTGLLAGNDNDFDGGAGNDTLDGGAGDDTLRSGTGADSVLGGDGNDLLVKDDLLVTSGDVFDGGAGVDTLDVSATEWGAVAIFDLAAGEGRVGTSVRDTLISIENLLVGGSAVAIGSSAANRIEGTGVMPGNSANNFSGGGGDDILLGGAGNDTLDGGNADDSLDGGSNEDVLLGGAGNDTLLGGAGNDILNGGTGADSMDGGTGNDTLSYSGDIADLEIRLFNGTANGGWATGDTITGFENLTLGNGNDFAQGTFGDNFIRGAAGNDTLVGLTGDDTLNGGGGDDLIFGDAGADSLIGSIGNDTITYAPDSAGVTVRLFNNFVDGGIATGDTIGGFENAIGGSGNDVLQGTLGANLLNGGGGNDTINGLGGNDTLLGGGGNDQIVAGAGAEELNAGLGFDMLSYFSDTTGVNVSLLNNTATGGNATGDTISNFENVTGGTGDDTLQGSATSNVLFGYNGDDTLNGLGGNDTLRGGFGEDYLLGGGGNDRLLGQVNADTLVGGAGDDTLTGGTAGDTFIFAGNFGQDTVTDFGFADVARIVGTGVGFNAFSDYDVNSDGLINAVDAGLTSKVTSGPGGDLTLEFNAAGTLSVFFDNVGAMNAADFDFV